MKSEQESRAVRRLGIWWWLGVMFYRTEKMHFDFTSNVLYIYIYTYTHILVYMYIRIDSVSSIHQDHHIQLASHFIPSGPTIEKLSTKKPRWCRMNGKVNSPTPSQRCGDGVIGGTLDPGKIQIANLENQISCVWRGTSSSIIFIFYRFQHVNFLGFV